MLTVYIHRFYYCNVNLFYYTVKTRCGTRVRQPRRLTCSTVDQLFTSTGYSSKLSMDCLIYYYDIQSRNKKSTSVIAQNQHILVMFTTLKDIANTIQVKTAGVSVAKNASQRATQQLAYRQIFSYTIL